MTDKSLLMTGGAIGLFALLLLSACDARTERAASGSAAATGTRAAGPGGSTEMAATPGVDHSAMADMDHSAMAGMDHSSMPGMAPAARTARAGETMDHSAMAGMDHSSMPGMTGAARRTARAGETMDHSAMAGMDHSAMAGMDHSSMPGMSTTPPTATTTGAMDHSAMQDMDHSGMAGMAGMAPPPSTGAALAASSPANGAMVQGSPGTISLTLPQPMTLQSVSLSNAVGQRLPLSEALPDGPVESFTSPVSPLPAGTYTVAWTAATGTRTVNGTFGFMVH